MKKSSLLVLPFFLATSLIFAAQHWPSPAGHVNDFAHVIPAGQTQAIENLLIELEQKTGSQVAVVTVPSVEGGDVEGAAVDLFKAWGIGQKGKDNGVLILASIQDRHMKIEVGYGLEPILPDGKTGSIIRESMIPFFKQGDYGQGLAQGAAAVAQVIAQNAGVNLSGVESAPESEGYHHRRGGGSPIALLVIIFLFLFLSFINQGRRRYRGGMWWGGFYGGGWGSGGGWGGGGGGGFGGFGGGSSGGGGASGSW